MGVLSKLFGSKGEIKTNPESQKPIIRNLHDSEINILGKEAEEKGDLDKAITLYEINLERNFKGNYPYYRLATLYRKKNMIQDEIRVLQKGISVFKNLKNQGSQRFDLNLKIQKFEKRLKRANNL